VLQDGRGTWQQRLGKVQVHWLGMYSFKGINGVRKMVYILQVWSLLLDSRTSSQMLAVFSCPH